uniref:Uncharacterized protein n=1 Tax=Arion vulgaris TaxID=1028688 RepID=A0A0B7AL93_9EUPU
MDPASVLYKEKCLEVKDSRHDVVITHRVPTANEKYGSNTVVSNIPHGIKKGSFTFLRRMI